MKQNLVALFFVPFLMIYLLPAESQEPNQHKSTEPAFQFREVNYFHRFSEKDLHEYTPTEQEDLKRWNDMVTINYYPTAKDGDGLAKMANATLGNYKVAEAKILKTSSVPRTDTSPAQHLIVVMFRRQPFCEVAFARFKMHEGTGISIVVSHRTYGNESFTEMNQWIKSKQSQIEKHLMDFDQLPKPPANVPSRNR